MNNSRKIWIAELEYLRGFAIIAVVIIHSTGRLWWFPYMQLPNILAVITTLVYSFSLFAVPLFIFISGFSLALRYDEKISPISFYKKRLKNIIPPYLIFSLVYILFYIIIGERTLKIVSIIFSILTASSSFHLWFIALIVQFYIIYPVLIKIYQQHEDRVYYLLAGSLVLQFAISIIKIIMSGSLIDNYSFASPVIKAVNILLDCIFLSYLFYFVLGIYASKNYVRLIDKLNKIQPNKLGFFFIVECCMSIILSVLWINKLYNFYFINEFVYSALYGVSSLFLSLMAFILLLRIATYLKETTLFIKNVINKLGMFSFGIYLVHIIFIRITALGLENFHIKGDDWLFYPLLIGMSLGLSYLSVFLMTKLTFSEVLIGFRSNIANSTP
jgi:peptidoglycan/LPS O-acetylase OafA/YrhL